MNRLYRALLLLSLPASAGVREAIVYLEGEVPRWKRENGCYSCHNNGDGARALLAARRAGHPVREEALRDSLANLADPSGWEQKTLAFVNFAAAIAETGDTARLAAAAAILVREQKPDGHWQVDEEKVAGSAVTYGPVLATHLAREVLLAAGGRPFDAAITRATTWLESARPMHVIDSASLVLALRRPADASRVRAAQAPNGSWNNEAFDTALGVLAMQKAGDARAARRGREFLLRTQLSGGGWPATTRPSGGESYAQHMGSTAWALIALLGAR